MTAVETDVSCWKARGCANLQVSARHHVGIGNGRELATMFRAAVGERRQGGLVPVWRDTKETCCVCEVIKHGDVHPAAWTCGLINAESGYRGMTCMRAVSAHVVVDNGRQYATARAPKSGLCQQDRHGRCDDRRQSLRLKGDATGFSRRRPEQEDLCHLPALGVGRRRYPWMQRGLVLKAIRVVPSTHRALAQRLLLWITGPASMTVSAKYHPEVDPTGLRLEDDLSDLLRHREAPSRNDQRFDDEKPGMARKTAVASHAQNGRLPSSARIRRTRTQRGSACKASRTTARATSARDIADAPKWPRPSLVHTKRHGFKGIS